mmetsp:Transcript_11765/g.21145  ORF Transcript_11765/g.21145 Transcript_11765/m.21145 type:complete len:479 (-) Transcript_11765:8-1444(-)
MDVLSLLGSELGELGAELGEMEGGNLLIEVLGKDVNLVLVAAAGPLVPELKLSNDLVGERAGHDEGRMASSASEVKETTLSKDNDTVAVGEDEAVALGLDVLALDVGDSVETSHVDLIVEVTNVSNDGVVLHLSHVGGKEDILVAGGGDEDIGVLDAVAERKDLVTLHASLESANRVNLGNDNASSGGLHGSSATLANITVTGNESNFAGNHDIGGTHDTIRKGVAAAVNVVELGLGDRVVDVDSREKEGLAGLHLIETFDASGGLLRNTLDLLGHPGEPGGIPLDAFLDDPEDDLELRVGGGLGIGELAVGSEGSLSGNTLVDKESGITTIINNEVGAIRVGPDKGLLSAPPVLLKSLTLPGEDGGGITSNGSSSVVLGREDVARAPADLSAKSDEGLNKDGSLNGHVQRTGDLSALERLSRAELSTASHKTRHLGLGKVKLKATEVSLGDVLDLVLTATGSSIDSARHFLSISEYP